MTLSLRRHLSALPALLAAAALTLGLTAAVTTLTAAPASAHDRMLSSDPADGAQLATPPTAITLTFNTEPLPVEPQVVVSDSAGSVVTQGAPTIEGSTATLARDPAVARRRRVVGAVLAVALLALALAASGLVLVVSRYGLGAGLALVWALPMLVLGVVLGAEKVLVRFTRQ